MSHPFDDALDRLGLTLPAAPAPAANYVPFVIAGGMLYVSGQISQSGGALIRGRLGADMDVEAGAVAARACALSILAQARAACGGDFGRIARLVKLTGFVASTPEFTDQPKVINGASDLFVAVMGEVGRHARSAVSAPSLPLGVAVEIEAIFELA
ncbi:MAG: hypothetical protein RLZ26_626 [Pseudomonadota bacterium]